MSEVLWPAARRAILGLLYAVPGRELHLREIARRACMAPATVQREAVALAEAGILTRRQSGHQTYYGANEGCPIFAEMRGLILKTSGLADAVRAALAPFGSRIESAFVYGSMADGTAGPDSDVDLCVVGKVGLRELASVIPSLTERLGREVNPVALTPEEFRELRQRGDHFISTILAGPRIDVVGCSNGA
jgi:predicted nucleotidyltransferase